MILSRWPTYDVDSKYGANCKPSYHICPMTVVKSIASQTTHQWHDDEGKSEERPHDTHTRSTQDVMEVNLKYATRLFLKQAGIMSHLQNIWFRLAKSW